MGEALVGGSFFSAFLQVLLDRVASCEVVDFFKSRKLNEKMLNKLVTTMKSVNAVLDNAEEKQVTKPAVQKWITHLKHAAYEVDDFLDEIAYETLRQRVEGPQNGIFQVLNFFSSMIPFKRECDLEPWLEDILVRLEILVKKKRALGLKDGSRQKQSSQKTPTTSVSDESSVCGRDSDKEAIMKLVLSSDENGNELGLIPILGMGGVGKTTLAQLVYNDSIIQQWFDIKSWVCVSKENDVMRITKDILMEVTSLDCDGKTAYQLQLELKDVLMGKKFLIVLDDVMYDNYAFWDVVLRPLKFGALGSVILITTRNESVAEVLCTVPAHYLSELNYEDSWLVFARHAFGDGKSNAHPQLEVIGREIAAKCNGLPLAAQTIGSLLRFERNPDEWRKISKSNLWNLSDNNILPALRLSYHFLPSHLKRCFAYCAMFPKDYRFDKRELILLWMAEGILDQSKGEKEHEERGDEYFQDLVSRSFFQHPSHGSLFVMHDLIHDLAQFVSEEFCIRLESTRLRKITKRTRHVSYVRERCLTSKKFLDICNAKILRTFLSVDTRHSLEFSRIDSEVANDMLPAFKRLRVLSLSNYNNIVVLPDRVGNMKHLRYLDLGGTSIKTLPESLQNLYNLQILILYGCSDLVELPSNMMKLINLCHLDIRETYELQEMPPQMGKLTKLRKLTDFIVGKQSGSSIAELGELQLLHEELCIWDLQNVMSAQDALKANLKGKKHLKKLELRWRGDTDNTLHDRNLLEQLQPHINVEHLEIAGYGGTRFPDWVGDLSFSNIVSLQLHRCKYCCSLPSLGQLGSLQDLSITAFEEVMVVGPEFYADSVSHKKPFGSLKKLSFGEMPQWSMWIPFVDEDVEVGAFPVLQELCIRDCPMLMKTLPSHLPSLTTLEIWGCHQQFVTSLPKAPALLHLKLDPCPSLEPLLVKEVEQLAIGFSRTLEQIEIKNCDSEYFPLDLFPKLKSLCISQFSKFHSLFTVKETDEHLEKTYGEVEKIHGDLNNSNRDVGETHEDFKENHGDIEETHGDSEESDEDVEHTRGDSEESDEDVEETHGNSEGSDEGVEETSRGSEESDGDMEETHGDSEESSVNVEETHGDLEETDENVKETLRDFEETHMDFASLNSLQISHCASLVCFSGGLPAPNLTELKLFNCSSLKSLPEHMNSLLPSLVRLILHACSEIESFPEGGLPSKLKKLEIRGCKKLIAGRMKWGLQELNSLLYFTIGDSEDVESFPEKTMLPSTLTTLDIYNLQNLKSLDYEGLQHLTVLASLDIWKCGKLESLPEGGLPSSLTYIYIEECPALEKRCQTKTGEDWPKISHIANIEISGEQVN